MKAYHPADDGWRIPDALWEKIEPLLPPPPPHPLGCHRQRVPNRAALDAIFLVLRTGIQWNALGMTRTCSSSAAHRRFQEWEAAGVFQEIWALGLETYDALQGIDWRWQAVDGAMHKAPLGGEKNRPQPHGSRQIRHERQPLDGRTRRAVGRRRGGSELQRLQVAGTNPGE